MTPVPPASIDFFSCPIPAVRIMKWNPILWKSHKNPSTHGIPKNVTLQQEFNSSTLNCAFFSHSLQIKVTIQDVYVNIFFFFTFFYVDAVNPSVVVEVFAFSVRILTVTNNRTNQKQAFECCCIAKTIIGAISTITFTPFVVSSFLSHLLWTHGSMSHYHQLNISFIMWTEWRDTAWIRTSQAV